MLSSRILTPNTPITFDISFYVVGQASYFTKDSVSVKFELDLFS
jgi:hypothetical protein